MLGGVMKMATSSESISIAYSLRKFGVALLEPVISKEAIARINDLISDYSEVLEGESRNYLSASDLLQLGVLDELFTDNFISVINHVMPDAVLYHCHYYSIPGHQTRSHIHADNGLNGWHRDDDCYYGWQQDHFHFITYFLYLTQVEESSGPFEIAPLNMKQPIRNDSPSLKVLGEPGCNFLFDRTFWHRATPNVSDKNREIIKLSFQHSYLPNERLALPEFDALRNSRLNDKASLHRWLHKRG